MPICTTNVSLFYQNMSVLICIGTKMYLTKFYQSYVFKFNYVTIPL